MNLPNQDIFYLLPMKHFHCFVEIIEIKQRNAMKRNNKHQKIPALYHKWPKDKKNSHITGQKKRNKSSIWVIACNRNSKCKQWASFSTKTHTMLDDHWPMPPKKMVFVHQDEQKMGFNETANESRKLEDCTIGVCFFLRIIK